MGRVFLMALAGSAAVFLATPASATITLVLGDNSLTTQIHALNGQYATGTLVQGVTKNPDGTIVNFTSTNAVDITGGSGYASIDDAASAGLFQDLSVALQNGSTFTGYEFTIQMLGTSVSKDSIGYLTINYTEGDGTLGSFTFNGSNTADSIASAAVRSALAFTGPGATDFRLVATNGETLRNITLSTNAQFDQLKQNDINLAPAVPEPATWAMMLLGFGAMGASLRRSRRRSGRMLQIA